MDIDPESAMDDPASLPFASSSSFEQWFLQARGEVCNPMRTHTTS